MARAGRRMKIGKKYHRPGTSPGTLTPPDTPAAGPVHITVIDYSAEKLVEKKIERVDDLAPFCDTPTVTWVNVEGLHDIKVLERIGQMFGFHPLALEDVLNSGQRPKVEDYGDYHFIVMKSLMMREAELEMEQISFFLSGNYVITFQEVPGDSFEAVRERIRKGKGQIRRMGPDYLLYALIDALIDEYFPVLEKYGERIEDLESEVVLEPSPETQVYLRDVYDHTIQVIDMIETFRDLASGMLDVYLSSSSNRLNEVMKVLTIISTIFIPLNFIAGVYGMNFHREASPLNMPELYWYFGYPTALAVMAATAGGLIVYFKRKGWF